MTSNGRVSPHTEQSFNSNQANGPRENVELNIFQYDSDENGNTDDDDDVMGIRNLFADLPSNVDQTRSIHSNTISRISLRRQKSARVKANAIDTNETTRNDVKDLEDGDAEMVKSIAAPMAQKKSFRRMRKSRRESQRYISSKLSYWKAFKLRVAMRWQIFKINIREFFMSLVLWRSSFKVIEGNFGNGVLSYFIFLKSLLFLNIMIFLVLFCFLVIPQIVIDYGHLINSGNITSPGDISKCPTVDKGFYKNRSAAEHTLDFFTGQGYINTTIMFYSNYHGQIVVNDDGLKYDMPLAYMLVGGSYIIVSLLIMVKNLAQGFTDSIIESGGFFYSYCNKVFASWDYCITNEKAVSLKCNVIRKDFIAELAEEKRLEKMKNRTKWERFKIYIRRFIITIIVMGLLAASIYAIIKAVEVSQDVTLTNEGNTFIVTIKRWASSLTISALNVILPLLFEILTSLEDWSPRVEVAMALWRAVLLKLASVAVLVITLFTSYSKDHGCQQCWENLVAGQMFNLIFVDFVVVVGITIVAETGRKYIYRYLDCGCGLGQKIGMQEFQIAKNVLDLVYGQSLIWIGAFFSPLLPILGIIKLLILFYVKKISLIYNCKPSSTPYQGARSNYFFTLLLLLTFLLCTVANGWGITKIPTSCCGPYSNTQCDSDKQMIDIIGTTIDGWPGAVRDTINFLRTAVFIFPLFIVIFLLLYYYHAMTKAHEKMIGMLKDQLIMEGKDKRFLMDRIIRASEQKKLTTRASTQETVVET